MSKIQRAFTTSTEAFRWIQEQGIDIHDIPEGVSVDILNDSKDYFEVTINNMMKTYNYRLELNGKSVEQGCTATMEAIRSAALYNARELHHNEIKVYAGDDHLEFLGTCQPDGTYTDSFGNSRKIDEDGHYIK